MASIESLDHASSVIKQLRVRSGHKSRYGNSDGAASSNKTGLESIQDFNKLIINTKDQAFKKEKALLQDVSPSSRKGDDSYIVNENSESFADNLKALMIGGGDSNNNSSNETKSSNQLKHLNEDETIESYIALAPVGRSVLQRRVGNNPFKNRNFDEDDLDFSSDDEAYHQDNQAINRTMMSPPKATNDFGLSEDDRNMYDDSRYNDMEGIGGFSLISTSTTSPKKNHYSSRQWSANNTNTNTNANYNNTADEGKMADDGTYINSPIRSSSAHSSLRNSFDPSTLNVTSSTTGGSTSRRKDKKVFLAGARTTGRINAATVLETDSGARIQVTAGQTLRVLPKAKPSRGSKTRALMDLKKEKEKMQMNKMSF